MFPNIPNGLCVCLVHGTHRSLVANVGASTHFTLEFLQTSSRLKSLIDEASLIHVEGFFLTERFQVCQYIVEHLHKAKKKLLSYNLNARYVCEDLTEESSYMAENADILIGNFKEFQALGKSKYDVETVGETISLLHDICKRKKIENDCVSNNVANRMTNGFSHKSTDEDPRRFGKIFAVTNSCKAVLVAWGTGELCEEYVPVSKMSPSDIVDTTGAGDTFMAGFMHAILNGLHPVPAARYAIHIATQKIKYNAPEMPPGPPPELDAFVDMRVEETTV